jgi:hypothetical protein
MATDHGTRACLFCGNAFQLDKPSDRRRFCSQRCGYLNRRKLETRICPYCQQPFVVKPADRQRCCSKICGARRAAPTRGPRFAAIDRFCRLVAPQTNGCWYWQGKRQRSGYGRFAIRHARCTMAHRWAYEYFIGPIPAGLEIDHLCRTRWCVNPLHLEAVTPAVNVARAAAVRTHCVQGHPFDERNTYWHLGKHRICRTCSRDRNRLAKRKRSAERRAGKQMTLPLSRSPR